MNLYLKSEKFHGSMMNSEVLKALGVQRLPETAMPPREIQGILVWVTPINPYKVPGMRRRCEHRIFAKCPVCEKPMSVGRLPQHAKVHQRAEAISPGTMGGEPIRADEPYPGRELGLPGREEAEREWCSACGIALDVAGGCAACKPSKIARKDSAFRLPASGEEA